MTLPLRRPDVPFVDFPLPSDAIFVRVELGGKFSRDSTVVFEGIRGAHMNHLNMRRIDMPNLTSNAIPGNEDTARRPIRCVQMVKDYDAIRVSCTRFAPGDAIMVTFTTGGSRNFAQVPEYVTTLVGELSVADLGEADRGPSYVISEEPDSIVDFLQG